ncbi:acyltransferase family protein [Phocaeicola sp.]
MKKSLRLVPYIKHRCLKLLVPFWICATLTVIIYAFTAVPISDPAEISASRVGVYYAAIGRGEYNWFDYLLCSIGLKPVNAANWFVFATFAVYVIFYIAKKCVGLHRRFFFLLVLTFSLVLFCIACVYMDDFHVYRDYWAVVAGFAVALYEKDIIKHKLVSFCVGGLVINLYLLSGHLWSPHYGLPYVIYGNLSMLTLAVFYFITLKYKLRSNKTILAWISGISYFIYLCHSTIMNAQYAYIGHISLWLIMIETLIAAWLVGKLSQVLLSKIN